MDIKDLILLNSDKVRRDSSLMAFYIESFFTVFGYRPNCAGCSFSSDWNKLVSLVRNGEKYVTLNFKQNKMENTFKLKKIQNKIFAYRIDKKTFRSYDNNFTESFVRDFLTYGNDEEIAERKLLFSVLPKEEVILKEEPVIIVATPVKTRKKRTPKIK